MLNNSHVLFSISVLRYFLFQKKSSPTKCLLEPEVSYPWWTEMVWVKSIKSKWFMWTISITTLSMYHLPTTTWSKNEKSNWGGNIKTSYSLHSHHSISYTRSIVTHHSFQTSQIFLIRIDWHISQLRNICRKNSRTEKVLNRYIHLIHLYFTRR